MELPTDPDKQNQGPGPEIKVKDSETRAVSKLNQRWSRVVTIIAILFSTFHLYTAFTGSLMAYKQRTMHLVFALVLTYLLFPMSQKQKREKPSLFDLSLALLSVIVAGYGIVAIDSLAMRGGNATSLDLFMGSLLILLVLEAGRRSVGMALPILAICFLAYGYLGSFIPGPLNHRGYSIEDIIYQMYLTTDGIFSMAIGVSSTYVVLFIIFGSFIARTGIITFFNQMALGLAGGQPGGQAKVAVVASAAMGTINGSAVANAMTTGAFTIPLMKKSGYSSYFAAAVEAVASTGGQIMPPVMGAAAFIMAEFLQMPYINIMIAAILPAILYFTAAFAQIHLRAVKTGLKGLPRETLPSPVKTLTRSGHSLIPLVLLVALMLSGLTATLSAALCIPLAILVGLFRAETRVGVKKTLDALQEAGKATVTVAMSTAVVGFVIGVTGLTNLGVNIADQILQLAGSSLMLTLIVTAIVCLILGMGLPTAGAYIIASIVAAPILIKMGVGELPAHFFIFYFAVISMITPPVALAAYATAGIAQAKPGQVGLAATKLGISGFVVPFMVIYAPSLFIMNSPVGEILWNVTRALMALLALSFCFEGYFKTDLRLWERVLFLAAGLLMIKAGYLSDIAGFSIFIVACIINVVLARKSAALKAGRQQT